MKNEELYVSLVDGILEIGNSKNIMKICEPNIMNPLKLERWMVERTLASYCALVEAAKPVKKGRKG